MQFSTFLTRSMILAAALGFSASASGQTLLRDGEPRANMSGASGSEKPFKLWVPVNTNQVQIQISGGTGDVDMYIRRGAPATNLSWSYRPYLWGNDESVTLNNPTSSGGAWYYVLLRGYQAYTGLTLRADFQAGPRLYDNGGVIKNLSAIEDQERHFKMVVPLNASRFIIKLSGGSGNADLYVRKFGPATDDYYDYRSTNNGTSESVVVSNPSSGLWYLYVRARDNYSGVKLTAEYEGLPKHRMSNAGLKDKADDVCFTKSPATSWRYGHWGGPGWTNAREVKVSAWNGAVAATSIDAMDELFRLHDAAIKAATTNAAVSQAIQQLLDGLNALPNGIGGVSHPVWGQIWDSPSPWTMPDTVTIRPGSPVALPQVILSATPMPYSEYARRQAKLGLTAGWFNE
jgi:hypothetical protein